MSVVTPSLVAGWSELSGRFGRLSLDVCLRPAIDIAARGVAAGYHCAYAWSQAERAPADFGRPPRVGEKFIIPDLVRSLRAIAENGPSAFYGGFIAEAIAGATWLDLSDLAAVHARWVRPLSLAYRGVDVFEMPPPTQGVAALEALGLVAEMGSPTLVNLAHSVALALEDAYESVRDCADVSHLTAADYLKIRRIDRPRLIEEPAGGTVYLCVLDGEGMAISLIQSLYEDFGSGIVAPGTGIILNNRASCFQVGELVEPGRRPYHTTIPGMLVEKGELRGPFGVMGGSIQAQAHVQLVSSLLDGGLDPQAALDLPRFRIDQGAVRLEEGLWPDAYQLMDGGYQVTLDPDRLHFGGGQAIQLVDGRILGGSDPRKDGFAAGF